MIGKSQHPIATLMKKSTPTFIIFPPRSVTVTIDFNDQHGASACKINDEGANHFLPSEFQAV
ncbi:hypothetical protein RLDS_05970 [Sphingobium lactosutens DS20]|uniref:Uncharacterized protein n=1 Tax=Sphingobium lactosutens DS20 TaxID=1331060 RepID=T0HY22_9SPHN|nr:hypothetical protein RLDS_05970 [Sphingobium lactosutens DS20]